LLSYIKHPLIKRDRFWEVHTSAAYFCLFTRSGYFTCPFSGCSG